MNYLHRLIERAVTDVDLENNKIGNYRIEPQHGPNCFVYNIYKTIAPRFSLRFNSHEEFMCDFVMGTCSNQITINWDREDKTDLIKIKEALEQIYFDKFIHIINVQDNDSPEDGNDTMSRLGTQRSPFGIGS